MLAIVGDVGGGDAATVFEHNGVGGRGRHGEQEQSREWRCALHIPILAMARAHVLAALLVYALSGMPVATVRSMLFVVKESRRGMFAAAAFPLLLTLASSSASPAFPLAANDSPVQSSSSDPRALYQALNALRPDGEHVYTIHELNLRRDVVNVRLIEGKLAFFQPIGGRVTGAVFSGRGHIFATPRERGERHSIAQYLGVPMVSQDFTRAYFRFTDDTAAEIGQQLGSPDEAELADWELP